MDAVNLAGKLATFAEHWQPRTVVEFNDPRGCRANWIRRPRGEG